LALEIVVPLGILALLIVWSAGSTSFYFPPVTDMLVTFKQTWLFDRFASDVLPSLCRLAAGYALAAAIGIGAGVVIGSVPLAARAAEPIVEFLRAIPPPALIPFGILVLGIGDPMKIFVITVVCLWPVLLNTVEGVRSVDEVLAETCRAYGVGGLARLRHLVLRSASPQIVTGMRQALSIAIILMVISEMFAASNGLGFTIVQFQRSFAIPEMWSGVLLLGLLGFALSLLFRLAENRVLAWYHGLRRAQRNT
ncbi:MAG TPA: ABC transporter permease subunit, partial [Actinomycetota bacterium]|nr:ABC transporter permease subunit [Actinomycetota bacterium]